MTTSRARAWLALPFLVACGAPAPAIAPPSTSSAITTSSATEPVVQIDSGKLRGRAHGASAMFRGVPYAAPPVGNLRWRPPAPAEKWNGIREATGYGYACMQSPSSYDPAGTPLGSEDCLTLNVFTPDLHPSKPLPVLVFIHGGFFAWGSASKRLDGEDIFDRSALAKNISAVVVTMNYRLGPLGFLAHAAFAHENRDGSDGNYGLEDQIAALEWVQKNIAPFGGDPSHVTLSGHSAGAISTLALMASPRAKGLFSSAIAFSGNGWARPQKRAEEIGAKLAHALGCNDENEAARCMRSRSASEVIAAMPESFSDGNGFGPNVDGTILPSTPIEMFRAGNVNAVPLLIGTTTDEFSTMAQTILTKAPTNEAEMKAQLAPRFGAQSDLIVSKYPITSYRSATDAVIHAWSDSAIVCPVRALSRVVAAEQPGRIWRFVFAHSYVSPDMHNFGAGHGLELPLLFRDLPEKFRMNSDEMDLARTFTDMIERFVWTGNPNGGTITWPAFDNETKSYLELDTPPTIKQNARASECDFWEAQWRK